MSLLKKIRDGRDIDSEEESGSNQSNSSLEKLYERLFMKIGRDFLHVEDFQRIMIEILESIDSSLIEDIDFFSNENALERAEEYKSFLEENIDGSNIYKDLIILEED